MAKAVVCTQLFTGQNYPVILKCTSIRRAASFHESIVNTVKAGLLTCNIFAILPAVRQWISMGKNF